MKKELLYYTAFLLLAASCSEDVALPSAEEDSDVLQLLSARVEDASGNGTQGGRAQVTTDNLDNLRLYATTTDGAAYVGNGGNAYGDYKLEQSTWKTTGSTQIKINSDATVYAIHPSGTTITQSAGSTPQASITIQTADGFTPDKQTDYLYSPTPQTVCSANHTVTFANLKHALAKVSFKVTKMGAESMTLTTLELRSRSAALLAGNGTMNILSGVLGGGLGGVQGITLTGSAVLESSLTSPNVTCLLAPVSNVTDLYFRLVIQTGSETRTLETDVLVTSQTWAAATHYVYTISVGKGQIEFSGMRIYDWMDDATTSIGIQ